MAVQFAEFADVQARCPVPIDAGQTNRVNALLQDASTVVKRYCRQTFVLEQTTELIRAIGTKLKLPHTPVVSLDSVFVIDFLDQKIPIAMPYWDGGDEVWLLYGALVINLAEGLREILRYNTPLCEVTYTHGYQTMPDEVVTIVCNMVLRVLGTPGIGAAVQSQTAPGYSAGLTPAAAAGVVALTKDEKEILDDFRTAVYSVELR